MSRLVLLQVCLYVMPGLVINVVNALPAFDDCLGIEDGDKVQVSARGQATYRCNGAVILWGQKIILRRFPFSGRSGRLTGQKCGGNGPIEPADLKSCFGVRV